jgi:hypothetical protein
MERRTFLSLAGIGLSVPVVGASAAVDGSGEGHPASGGRGSPGEGDLDSFDPDAIQAEVELGNRAEVANASLNRPHDLAVWNATGSSISVELRIADAAGEHPPFKIAYGVPADDAVVVALLEPSEYSVEVDAPVEEADASMTVPRSRFDCNDSTTQIGVFEDGTVKSRLVTTLAFCTDADVTDVPDELNGSVPSDL